MTKTEADAPRPRNLARSGSQSPARWRLDTINRGVDLCVLPDKMERVLRWHWCCRWERGGVASPGGTVDEYHHRRTEGHPPDAAYPESQEDPAAQVPWPECGMCNPAVARRRRDPLVIGEGI